MVSLLFYERYMYMPLPVLLSTLSSAQSHGTESTAIAMVQLLNYCDTHPDAAIWYKNSDMIITIHSDASYLSNKKCRIWSGGHFY